MAIERLIDWCKRVYLRWWVGYRDPQRYWDRRWSLRLIPGKSDYTDLFVKVQKAMQTHGCANVLELGCGRYPLSALPGHFAMDFSIEALRQSGLRSYICGDITERIPLPDKSVDAVYISAVLLHISPEKITQAVREVQRVAKKAIILNENRTPFRPSHDCYCHDYDALFRGYPGVVVDLTQTGGLA